MKTTLEYLEQTYTVSEAGDAVVPLNDWEENFIKDNKARVQKYGPTTRFSAAQEAKIFQCWDKVMNGETGR